MLDKTPGTVACGHCQALGAATSVSEIKVAFPGGKTVVFAGPIAADQRVWLFEDGTTHLGWAPKP